MALKAYQTDPLCLLVCNSDTVEEYAYSETHCALHALRDTADGGE